MSDEQDQAAGQQQPQQVSMSQEEFDRLIGQRLRAAEEDWKRREAAAIEEQVKQKYEADLRLGEALRQQGHNPEALMQRYELEQQQSQAQQAGIPIEVWKRLTDAEQQSKLLEEKLNGLILQQQESSVASKPGYAENQGKIRELARAANLTLEQAYRAIVPPEAQAKAAPGSVSEQEAIRQVLSRDLKGLPSGGGTGQPQMTFRDLNEAQLKELADRVLRGERITGLS